MYCFLNENAKKNYFFSQNERLFTDSACIEAQGVFRVIPLGECLIVPTPGVVAYAISKELLLCYLNTNWDFQRRPPIRLPIHLPASF